MESSQFYSHLKKYATEKINPRLSLPYIVALKFLFVLECHVKIYFTGCESAAGKFQVILWNIYNFHPFFSKTTHTRATEHHLHQVGLSKEMAFNDKHVSQNVMN